MRYFITGFCGGALLLVLMAATPVTDPAKFSAISLNGTNQVTDSGTLLLRNGLPVSRWTNLPTVTDMEGGTVYGWRTVEEIGTGVIKYGINDLTNFWGTPSPIISIGLPAWDVTTVAKSNAVVFLFGNDIVPDDIRQTWQLYGVGDAVWSVATISNCFELYGYGSRIGNLGTFTDSGEVIGVGRNVFSSARIRASQQIYGIGREAFELGIVTNCTDIFAIGISPLQGATLNGCTDIFAIGKGTAQGAELTSITHAFAVGSGSVISNSNDFVFGDNAYNYKFPGASADFAGPITAKISVTASPGTDDTYQGTQITGLNNSGGVTQWDTVYLNSSSQWVLADANGTGTYPARGIASATVATANATTIITSGTIRNDAWNWTPGGTIYLSTTPGGLTQTQPNGTGDKIQVMGYALTADIMAVAISADYGTVP